MLPTQKIYKNGFSVSGVIADLSHTYVQLFISNRKLEKYLYMHCKIPIISPRAYFWSKGILAKFFLGRGA